MKSARVLISLAAIGWMSAAFGLQEKPAAELQIAVRLPDGSPAKGIKVQQVQLERTSPFPRNFVCGVTDGEGRLTVKFVPMRSQGDDRNGYGVYRYVLMPQDRRWELSDIYYWNKEPWTEPVLAETDIWSHDAYLEMMRSPEFARSNWSVGNLVHLPAGEQVRWNLTLQPGRDVRVSVVDQFAKPLVRKTFAVELDAGVLSHTGSGGEIPVSKVETDEQGQFSLPHAGDFWYSFTYECETTTALECGYCAPDQPHFTTTVRGKFDQPDGSLRYFKRIPQSITVLVRDKSTRQPIPGASISLVMLFPSAAQGAVIGKTDQDGKFSSDKMFTEHVGWLAARKESYKESRFEMKNFVPGATCILDMEPERPTKTLGE